MGRGLGQHAESPEFHAQHHTKPGKVMRAYNPKLRVQVILDCIAYINISLAYMRPYLKTTQKRT